MVSPVRRAMTDRGWERREGSQVKEMEDLISLPKTTSPDPKAWTIKYLTADSLSDLLFWYRRIGRKPIKLTSRPPQTPNQCEEEMENKVPNTATNKNRKVKGKLENIKKKDGANHPKQS